MNNLCIFSHEYIKRNSGTTFREIDLCTLRWQHKCLTVHIPPSNLCLWGILLFSRSNGYALYLSTKHVWKYRSGFISFSSCFSIHSALFFNPSKLYKMKLRSVFKNKPGNLTEVNILQWHKAHSGMITSEETFWAPKHINRFFLMKSQHCPKDIYFRFIVTLRNDIPIFVVYTMMRKSFSFCYFFRFKIWVTMYIHVWRKFIRRGQSSTQWFSPGRGVGEGGVKVCRKGGGALSSSTYS